MTNEDQLIQVFAKIMAQSNGKEWDPSFLASLSGEKLHMIRFEKGDYLAHMGLPLERILIHLDGQVAVFKYSHGGTHFKGDVSEAPQIYGLYETLNGLGEHGATLQATSAVQCVAVSPAFLLRAIRNNHEIALIALSFLAKFTDKMLNRNDQLTLNTPYENLLIYLFERSAGKAFPVVIPASKHDIAAQLNISNRTLYRQLEQLEQEGMIQRRSGKIVISEAAFKQIQLKYDACLEGLDI